MVVQLVTIAATLGICNDLQKLLIAEIFRGRIALSKYHKAAESMSGYVLVLFELGCAFGSFVSAKLIDKFKKHKVTLCAIIALSIIFASGLVLGFQYKKILFSYVSNTFFGILVCAAAVPIFDMLLQHTYPTNPAFGMLIFVGVYKFASVVLGEICRLLLNYFNDVAVFIFMIMLLLMGLVTCAFLQPKYEKNAASKVRRSSEENSPLLNNNEQQ